ncbi:hypothetical protein ACFFWD_37325 [Bradyrhizobium erythrophlei]|uniref:hypothetical protein n=1 Tax=Bradyrhizobium erythrophlei TaxID=1437360 RepID=UPI0035E4D0B9
MTAAQIAGILGANATNLDANVPERVRPLEGFSLQGNLSEDSSELDASGIMYGALFRVFLSAEDRRNLSNNDLTVPEVAFRTRSARSCFAG